MLPTLQSDSRFLLYDFISFHLYSSISEFTYTLTTDTLWQPIHFDNRYTLTTDTLWQPIHFDNRYTLTIDTLWQSIHFDNRHTLTTDTLWQPCFNLVLAKLKYNHEITELCLFLCIYVVHRITSFCIVYVCIYIAK